MDRYQIPETTTGIRQSRVQKAIAVSIEEDSNEKNWLVENDKNILMYAAKDKEINKQAFVKKLK